MCKLIVALSNKTQLEVFLSLKDQISATKHSISYILIHDMTNSHYAAGLSDAIHIHRSHFEKIITFKKKHSLFHLMQLIRFKKVVSTYLQDKETKGVLTFSEGGAIDWIIIGIANHLDKITLCLQWAITWPDEVYNKLKRPEKKGLVRDFIKKHLKIFMGFNYKKMTVFGNGDARHVLTLGEFWTDFLSKKYPTLAKQEKYITFGNPKWSAYKQLSKKKKQQHLLFCTGAGPSLWNSSMELHIDTIRKVYEGCQQFLNENQLILYHKPHPRDKATKTFSTLMEKYSNIKISQEPLSQLFEKCNRMITIRSTTGFEAILAGLQLIIFDDGSQEIGFDYSEHNLAQKASNGEQLELLLKENLIQKSLPKASIEYFIETEYCGKNLVQILDLK